MKSIRIGNDISIHLTVSDVETLEGRDLMVVLSTFLGRKTIVDITIEGNTVSFVFPGKEQRFLGIYTITVMENAGQMGQHIVDVCNAFRLVARSCNTGGTDPDNLETVSLAFDFDLTLSGAVEYSDLKGKPKLNGVEIAGNKTLADYGIIDTTKVLSKDIATIIEDLNEN